MNCHECQTWISDALDGMPFEPARPAAEHHRAACKACSAFERTLRALEPHLKLQANHPRLSGDFASTVMRRLPAAPKRLRAEEIVQRGAQFEREQREALTALRRRAWPWQLAAARPNLAVIAAIVGGAWLVVLGSDLLLSHLSSAGWGLDRTNGPMVIALGVALAALIWNWKRRSSGWRWPRRFQMMLRPLHATEARLSRQARWF